MVLKFHFVPRPKQTRVCVCISPVLNYPTSPRAMHQMKAKDFWSSNSPMGQFAYP